MLQWPASLAAPGTEPDGSAIVHIQLIANSTLTGMLDLPTAWGLAAVSNVTVFAAAVWSFGRFGVLCSLSSH